MSYFISDYTVDFYTAEKFAKMNNIKFLGQKELTDNLPDGGPFWTATRVSCSTQLVWQKCGKNMVISRYDKTFTAFMFGITK